MKLLFIALNMPSTWSSDGNWIAVLHPDKPDRCNEERMLKADSKKHGDSRPVWGIRPDGRKATLIEPLRFQMAMVGGG